VREGWNDEQLLTALGEALRAREDVPARFLETARNAYAWHNIDAELAQLTYDSSRDQALASVRSETASIRALTFTSAQFSMDLEVTDDCLLGQIMPPLAGTLEVQARDGAAVETPVDEAGGFSVEPIPPSPFRLHYRSAEGSDMVTGWITL
jgi:hypothetical protein